MGSAEPIDFLRGVLEPIKFWEWKVKNWYILGSMRELLKQNFKADHNFKASVLKISFLNIF